VRKIRRFIDPEVEIKRVLIAVIVRE
jgi:hypothetical protein